MQIDACISVNSYYTSFISLSLFFIYFFFLKNMLFSKKNKFLGKSTYIKKIQQSITIIKSMEYMNIN